MSFRCRQIEVETFAISHWPSERLMLPDYIMVGLLFWGIAGSFIFGATIFGYAILTCVPILAIRAYAYRGLVRCNTRRMPDITPAIGVILLIYIIEAFLTSRYKLSLFFPDALDSFIDDANATVGKGRGAGQLVVAAMAFLPFLLLDLFKSYFKRLPLFAILLAVVLIAYEAGISRGFLMLGLVAAIVAYARNLRRVALAGTVALVAFNIASVFRGDDQTVHFSNPFFDGIIFPFYNLVLATESDCPSYGSVDYVLEFLKKFVPSFIFDKEVLSFNILMTRCIYPTLDDEVDSISVFTYLSEVLFFTPSWLTSLLIGGALGGLAMGCEQFLRRWRFNALRMFAGLLMIFALRSRSLDVATLLLLLLIVLFAFHFLASRGEVEAQLPDSYPSAER